MSALGRKHTSQALPPQSLYAGAKRLPRRRLGANFGAFVLKFAVGLRILALNRQMTRYPADNRHRIRRQIAGMHGERVPSVEIGRRLLWRFRLVPPEPSRARRTRGSRWLRWPSTKLQLRPGRSPMSPRLRSQGSRKKSYPRHIETRVCPKIALTSSTGFWALQVRDAPIPQSYFVQC